MYDPSYPEINHSVFKECNWSEFYKDSKEAILMNASKPGGNDIDILIFVDSDHAGTKVSCRLRSGFLICEHCISAVVFKRTVYSRDISF